MRKTCLRMVYELAKQDERIIFIGSDLGAGVLDDFKRDMPDRFFMEGVSEQHMVGMAAGLALSGKIVYCHTISTFLTRRAYEQIYVDVGMHHANVRLIGAGGGAVYAPLGPTHLATDDIALMRSVPGMTILAPCDAVEMEALMPQTVEYQGPIYIRLGRGGDPRVSMKKSAIGEAVVMADRGSRLLFVSTGTATQCAVNAHIFLRSMGADSDVLHVPTLKPFDASAIRQWRGERVVTVEDHSVTGGLGSAVAEVLAESGSGAKLLRIGYPDEFPHGYGTQDELRGRYGLSAEAIVQKVRAWANA